jgi:hypothetical protein
MANFVGNLIYDVIFNRALTLLFVASLTSDILFNSISFIIPRLHSNGNGRISKK